jgi:hypothetical protein
MRITRQVPAFVAVAALMAPAAAAAAPSQLIAHKDSIPTGSCKVSLFVAPHEVANGEAAEVYGRLGCIGGGDSGQTVTVYGHPAGTTVFTVLGTASTGPAGFYSYIDPKLTTDTTFYASAAGANSASKQVKVAPLVTFETLPLHPEGANLLTGPKSSVTFTGVVSPADAGARVVLQRENATSSGFTWFEEWRAIQVGIVRPGGTYVITHTFVLPGEANLRVLVRPYHRLDVRGMSNPLSYEISQPENASLELTGSPNPISDGQTVTLKGKVAGASDAPVTLLAHVDGNDPFAKVATTMTNSSGEYTFTQSPTESTYYQADSGSTQSTVQFEGVKYVLTAAASTESIHSGEAVTFSGTVTPIRKGHIVYLERQNTGPRGGWHVVDTGAVSETGTYTITDYLFGLGTGTYRVLIPGDFANQAMASQTFAINVGAATSAPPALVPPATLPPEGKV